MSVASFAQTVVDDLVSLAEPLVSRAGRAPRIVAVAEGDGLALYEAPGKGAPRRLAAGEKRKAGGPVELRLPADAVLTRSLTLPAAGREFLEPILEHRLERLIPWAPDRAIYGYRVTGETDAGELSLDFAATSRDIADRWTARAEALGLQPGALGSAAEPLDRPLAIDLWRGERDRAHLAARRFVTVAAAVAAAVVLPALALSLYASYAAESRLAEVEARSITARAGLQRAMGAGESSREAALIGAKRPDAAMVTLIDRLARAVPQDTALRDLEIDEGRIRLAGSSAASPALIGRLEASGIMRGARFAAPVTRAPDGRDNFEILADRVRPEPQARAAALSGAPGR